MKNPGNPFYTLLLLILSVASARAGTSTHGGDIVLCEGSAPMVLDYYHASLRSFGDTQSPAIDVDIMSGEDVVNLFRGQFQDTLFANKFEEALAVIGPIQDWIQADLRDVADSNEPYYLPSGCTLAQGAVRQNTTMFIDPTYTRNLSVGQLGVLLVHEALFYVATEHGQVSSESVRALIRAGLAQQTNRKKIETGIRELGEKVFPVEQLPGLNAIDSRGYLISEDDRNAVFGRNRLVFRNLNLETLTLQAYVKNPSGIIQPLNPFEFTCTANGRSCTIVPRSGPGWIQEACTFTISTSNARRLDWTCPTLSIPSVFREDQ